MGRTRFCFSHSGSFSAGRDLRTDRFEGSFCPLFCTGGLEGRSTMTFCARITVRMSEIKWNSDPFKDSVYVA